MTHNSRHYRRIMNSIVTVAYVLLVTSPILSVIPVHAQEAPVITEAVSPTESAEVPPPQYVFNPETGLWENGTYAWDPATNTTKPLQKNDYSYNPETQHWDTEVWIYDPATGAYIEKPTPPPPSPSISQPIVEEPTSNTVEVDDVSPISSQKIMPMNASSKAPESGSFYNGFFDADISITVNSSAISGSANVINNTLAGDATSGTAIAQASILNMVNSTWGNGQSPPIYTVTMQGGYIGDLVLDPTANLTVNSSKPTSAGVAVTNAESVSITNDVVLDAQSGDATVSGNTEAGNATTGNALALATIMNLINSSVSSGESFIGILNILGDFEGDVLLPEHLQDELANAYVPQMQMTIDPGMRSIIDNNAAINMSTNVNAIAQSGDASVTNNTIGGNSATGDSQTSVTVFNITGQQVLSENAMLVFVNVLGEWVGLITNAPQGARSALYSCCSNQNSSGSLLPGTIINDVEYNIVNNVSLSATSGDATVSGNTIGGDATTGSAFAGANIVNLANTSLNLSGWFSVLFINIFGNWNGSFGVDTAYGGYSTLSPTGGDTGNNTPTPMTQSSTTTLGVSTSKTSAKKVGVSVSSKPKIIRISSEKSSETQENETQPVVAGLSSIDPTVSDEQVSNVTSAAGSNALVWISTLGLGTVVFVAVGRRLQTSKI